MLDKKGRSRVILKSHALTIQGRAKIGRTKLGRTKIGRRKLVATKIGRHEN